MGSYLYSTKGKEGACAKAVARSASISRKQSIEIANKLRGMKVSEAKKLLERVKEQKEAIPYRRFTDGVGHKRNTGAGRYPYKASSEILRLVETAEANAQFIGLNTNSLIIAHISAQQGPKVMHYGRKRRRQMKRAHIELILEETEKTTKREKKTVEKKAETQPKKAEKKEKKTEQKTENQKKIKETENQESKE